MNIETNTRRFLREKVKGNLKDLYWILYGRKIRNPRLNDNPTSFLFVCKGNICRSPFAEHVGRKVADYALSRDGTFHSVGLQVSQPLPPPEEAVLAAKGFDVQLDGHRSKSINREMVEIFDMIIAMEAWQFATLRKAFPSNQDKVFLLPLFDAKGKTERNGFSRYNIQDPYGKNLDEFYACFQRIERCIEGMFEEIK